MKGSDRVGTLKCVPLAVYLYRVHTETGKPGKPGK